MKTKLIYLFSLLITLSNLFPHVLSGIVADKYGSPFADVQIKLDWVGTNYSNGYDPNNVANSKRYLAWRSNISTWSDANGYYEFRFITNGIYNMYVYPPQGLTIPVSYYYITNVASNTNINLLVDSTNLTLLPDTLFPPYYLASRQDFMSLQILKSNAVSERVIVSLIKVNGKDKLRLVDGYFSAMNNRTVVSSENLRKILTTGSYLVETKIVPTGKSEYDLGLPTRYRLFVYSE